MNQATGSNPTLIMLTGPAGCGKSTLAYSIQAKTGGHVFSSDAIRAELFGDESIQRAPQRVFALLHERVMACLALGGIAIYDATNLQAKYRKQYIDEVRAVYPNCNFICVGMTTDLEACLAQNAGRKRQVPEDVIRAQYQKYQYPQLSEGWDLVMSDKTDYFDDF